MNENMVGMELVMYCDHVQAIKGSIPFKLCQLLLIF